MTNLELAKYYAKQAKNVYAGMSYDDIGSISKYEDYVVEYSGCRFGPEHYSVLLNAYYVGIIDIDELIVGLTESYEQESGA